MSRLGVSESTVRKATGWLGDKLFELKLSIDDRDGGARSLRALQLIETLELGIEGKRTLWLSLRGLGETTTTLNEFDLDGLLTRAEAQKHIVERKRLEVASAALSSED